VRVLDLTYPVEIPPEETTYRVMYFKLPDNRCVTVCGPCRAHPSSLPAFLVLG
jgi:hypothetical protein